jgi:hypothetical protein
MCQFFRKEFAMAHRDKSPTRGSTLSGRTAEAHENVTAMPDALDPEREKELEREMRRIHPELPRVSNEKEIIRLSHVTRRVGSSGGPGDGQGDSGTASRRDVARLVAGSVSAVPRQRGLPST